MIELFTKMKRSLKYYRASLYNPIANKITHLRNTIPFYCPVCKKHRGRVAYDDIYGITDMDMYESHLYCDECRRIECTREAIKLIEDDKLVIIDTETTGLNFNDEIIEIAIIDPFNQKALLDTLVKPTRAEISPNARAVHGIDYDMLEDAPTWSELWPKISNIITDKNVASYNWAFDSAMMNSSCRAASIERGTTLFGAGKSSCIMTLAARYFGDWSYKYHNWRYVRLSDAAYRLNTENEANHRALGDALTAANVLVALAGTSYDELYKKHSYRLDLDVPF